MCCFEGRTAASPSAHTTLGHDHKLGFCFYNHYFYLFLTMKVQRARSSRSRDQLDVWHWRLGWCAHTRLERDLSITRVRKGNRDHSVFFAFLSVTAFQSASPSGLSCLVSCCGVLRWLFFFFLWFLSPTTAWEPLIVDVLLSVSLTSSWFSTCGWVDGIFCKTCL